MCMRVTSTKSITLRGGETGYIHLLKDAPKSLPPEKPRPPSINSLKLMTDWDSRTRDSDVERHAISLGVTPQSLRALGIAWAQTHQAWAFPMCDGYRNYVGIRLRSENGTRKWAVTGSHQGLFLPFMLPKKVCYICEGPTDTAAALSLGVFAIGRPSCSGAVMDTDIYFRSLPVKEVVIIADNDGPGLAGADVLSRQLTYASVNPIATVVIILPCKDMREFVMNGGTAEMLHSITNNYVWNRKQ